MADIWTNLGVDITKGEGEWFYKIGTDVRGPMPHHQLVEKLLSGEVDFETMVAREGTDYHPIRVVAAFGPHLENARRKAAGRVLRRRLFIVVGVALPLLTAMVGGYFYAAHVRTQRGKVIAAQRKKADEAAAIIAKKAEAVAAAAAAAPKMGLVALVDLGTAEDVHIHHEPSGKRRGKKGHRLEGKPAAGEPAEEAEPAGEDEPEEVQGCKLSQQEIFGTLRGALTKLNVCVEDEKKRDVEHLLPAVLELQFVVKTSGKVGDFSVTDRHYRAGPLSNCLTRVFNGIAFPSSSGANCPVTIPIKIGKK